MSQCLYTIRQFFDAVGNPLNGGTIYSYQAGTTTPMTVYPTLLDAQNLTNGATSITIAADGSIGPIWFNNSTNLKLVIKDSGGNIVPNGTIDNIFGESSFATQGITLGGTLNMGNNNIEVGSGYGILDTSGNNQLLFNKSSTAVNYLTMTNAASGSSPTITTTGSDTNIGLNFQSQGTGRYIFDSALELSTVPTVASATTTDLTVVRSNVVKISGTTTITSFGSSSQICVRDIIFTGALQLTYNATSMILPTAANITTSAGDTARFIQLSSGNWTCIDYVYASGRPLHIATSSDMTAEASAVAAITPSVLSSMNGRLKGAVEVDSVGNVSYSYNFTSISATGTGAFTVTWSNTVNNPFDLVSIQNSTPLVPYITGYTSTTTLVGTSNLSGTATQASHMFIFRFGNS